MRADKHSEFNQSIAWLSIAVIASALVAASALGQSKDNSKDKPDPDATSQLRIEVTAGEKSTPVDMASVYVRYVIKHTLSKDENAEMNIKTNKDGVAIAPGVPRGKVLVQVIAQGWKTFGEWFDVTQDEQTIKIHLDKPPKWF